MFIIKIVSLWFFLKKTKKLENSMKPLIRQSRDELFKSWAIRTKIFIVPNRVETFGPTHRAEPKKE